MSVFFFLACVVLVAVIASILIAQLVVRAPFFDAIGPFSAGLLGVAGCFVVAYCLLFLLDPDPVSEFDAPAPRHLRTLPITGLSAFIWLPIYTNVFNRLRRKKGVA